VNTGTNGFIDPQPGSPLSLGAAWGTEERIVGAWDLSGCNCGDGVLYDQTRVAYTNGIAPGQKLQLYWFPSLTLASNMVGTTYYGEYTDANSPPLDGSDAWQIPASDSSAHLIFWTALFGGSNPDAAGQATRFASVPLVASFIASPTYGTAPLAVTFTDTSTGTITNRFWDFGDTVTTNITTNSVTHYYDAGTFTVSLVITGPGGVSTNTQLNYIATSTPFQNWQIQYFGSRTNGLFRSTDSGATWQALPGQPTALRPTHGIWASDGMLYISYSTSTGPGGGTDGAVWKFNSKPLFDFDRTDRIRGCDIGIHTV